MKATTIFEWVFEGLMDVLHGVGFPIRRLIIGDPINLTTTVSGQVPDGWMIQEGINRSGREIVVGEVEISEEVMERVTAFLNAKKRRPWNYAINLRA